MKKRQKRTERFGFRVTKDEARILRREARKSKLSISDIVIAALAETLIY